MLRARRLVLFVCLVCVPAFLYAEEVYLKLEDVGVVVTATKNPKDVKELGHNVDVIEGSELDAGNYETLSDVLDSYVGITDASRIGDIGSVSTARIRGNGSNYTLVMVDGQVINDPYIGGADIGGLDLTSIDRIEIIRGPSSALWGSAAIGGVINIITKKARGHVFKSNIKSVFGSNGFSRYSIGSGVSSGRKDVYMSVNLDKHDGWRENSGYDGQNILFRFGYEVDDANDISIRFISHNADLGVPGSNTTSLDNYDGTAERRATTPNETMSYGQKYIQVRYNRLLENGNKLSVRTYSNLGKKIDEDMSASKYDLFDVIKYGMEMKFDTESELTLGYQLDYDEYMKTNKMTSTTVDDFSSHTNAFFAQQILYTGNIMWTVGTRYDEHSKYGSSINPKLSSIFLASDRLKFSFNIGKSFRALSFSEYQPGFKHEEGWGEDIGLEYLCKSTDFMLTFFRQDIKNKISWADYPTAKQVKESYSQGIELGLRQRLSACFLQDINYTYTDSKVKENDTSPYLRDAYIPYNKINYKLKYNSDFGFESKLIVSYIDEQDWQDTWSTYHLDGVMLVDLIFNHSIDNIDLFLAINNIFDEKYQNRLNYPLPGTELRAGINIKC